METSNITVLCQDSKSKKNTVNASVVAQIAPTGLLTTEQAANYLSIAPGTLAVWRSTNRKILAYVKIGSQVRYRREDLEKFISANLCNA